MIVIVDYGMGNLGSIRNMLSRIGADSILSSSAQEINAAEKIILPGVGAFAQAMENLHRLSLIPTLNEKVLQRKTPVLGICLGVQLFTRYSEEGNVSGLGWIDAQTVRFQVPQNGRLRLPHMGWNSIEVQQNHSLFDGMHDDSRFYFVHSYHVRCNREENVLACSQYGIRFHSAVIKENIVGTQFHPEKSHRFGMKILENFVKLPNNP